MLSKIIFFLRKNYLILLILLLGFFLRIYHYPQFPIAGETADETAWTMLGASLIQEKQPTSWTYFPAYRDNLIQRSVINENGDEVIISNLARPVLDHPPLFSFIPGFFHSLKNSWDQTPSMKLIRFPMIFIGTLNLYFLFLVAKEIFNQKYVVYLSALVYAVVPSFIFSSRLVVAENLLITWMLLTIYLLKSSFKNRNLFLILISIAAILTKVSGLIIPLGIILYAWEMKDKTLLKDGVLGLLIGELIYFIYGAVLNWQLFIEVNLSQAGRDLGLSTLVNRLFLHPAIVEKFWIDGWIWLGLFALMSMFLLKPKNFLAIQIYSILWLLFIAATAGEQTFHGWYDYPLYPLFALAIAWIINYLYQNKMHWLMGFCWLLVSPTMRMGLVFSHQYQFISNFLIRGLVGMGFLPLGMSLIKKPKLSKYSLYLIGGIIMFFCLITVFTINEVDYWEMDRFYYSR